MQPPGGSGPSVTAAVTSATNVTGSAVTGTAVAGSAVTGSAATGTGVAGTVRGIGGVKVGDEVSAQITGTASHLAATAIQDPAQ